MKTLGISGKLIAIILISAVCFVASLFVLGITHERQSRFESAQREIAESWGKKQSVIGPMLVIKNTPPQTNPTLPKNDTYILPSLLSYETTLVPETRKRGIFESIVYTTQVKVSGEFSAEDLRSHSEQGKNAIFSVIIADTRGIEQQVDLVWDGVKKSFEPGPGKEYYYMTETYSGLHATVNLASTKERIPFSFEVGLKGSEGISFAPLGKETTILASSSWTTPKFVGAFLPSNHSISEKGFEAQWRISSFGRTYPQTWVSSDSGITQSVFESTAGIDLYDQVSAYDLTFRSIKYAILFIIMTFATFFLFDVLTRVHVHAIQYLLIGSALALFYLLLLSLSEHIGFLLAYIVATSMTVALIGGYSMFVLRCVRRSLPIVSLLTLLYGYLYFTLQLEDYALLFGSLLLFIFLAVVMFLTRNIDWGNVDAGGVSGSEKN